MVISKRAHSIAALKSYETFTWNSCSLLVVCFLFDYRFLRRIQRLSAKFCVKIRAYETSYTLLKYSDCSWSLVIASFSMHIRTVMNRNIREFLCLSPIIFPQWMNEIRLKTDNEHHSNPSRYCAGYSRTSIEFIVHSFFSFVFEFHNRRLNLNSAVSFLHASSLEFHLYHQRPKILGTASYFTFYTKLITFHWYLDCRVFW
jgi:hypothetical protein